jgi:hypothetical protein
MKKLYIILICSLLSLGAASLNFDNANDEVDMGNVLDVTTGDVSFCIWVKSNEAAQNDWNLGKKNNFDITNGVNSGYGMMERSANDTTACFISDTDGHGKTAEGNTDNDGVWTFQCCVWNASTEVIRLYRDGAQEASGTGAGNIDSLTTASEFAIGEDGAEANDYNGLQAYASQFGSVLTVEEINELRWKPEMIVANRGGFWTLWGESPATDLSGNGFAGTLSGVSASNDGPPVMFGGGLPL